MGYEVFITRRKDSYDESSNITLEEWKSYISSDAEMELEGFAEVTNPKGEIVRAESEGIATWTRPTDKLVYYFCRTHGGEVSVTKPDVHALTKMSEIADSLNARVEGEAGELYDENGEVVKDSHKTGHSSSKRAWWQF